MPVEVGHRICTACTMGNIANELKRPLYWNPEKEIFLNDEAANTMLKKEYRKEYM